MLHQQGIELPQERQRAGVAGRRGTFGGIALAFGRRGLFDLSRHTLALLMDRAGAAWRRRRSHGRLDRLVLGADRGSA